MLKQTPSQTVGPYFAYGLTPQQYHYDFPSVCDATLANKHCQGQAIQITGQVFDGAGKPIGDAMLEFLQADSQGRYVDDKATPGGDFRGFARIGTGTEEGHHYTLHTVKPGVTASNEAPHINIIVLMRGLLLHAYTRLYFDDEASANSSDELLASVPADRRPTLIAKRQDRSGVICYRFDIHMQGQGETVFFDV